MSGLELKYDSGYKPTEKKCPSCKKTKPIAEFPRVYRDRWVYCRPCHNDKKAKYQKRWRDKNKPAAEKPLTILERYKCRRQQQSTKS